MTPDYDKEVEEFKEKLESFDNIDDLIVFIENFLDSVGRNGEG